MAEVEAELRDRRMPWWPALLLLLLIPAIWLVTRDGGNDDVLARDTAGQGVTTVGGDVDARRGQ